MRYAERYSQRENDSSLYSVYLDVKKPFDTRQKKAAKLYEQMRQELGLSDLMEDGLPDWTAGYDIADYINENDLDYNGIILNEDSDLVNGQPVSRGESIVVRHASQIKNTDNLNPTTNPDIRFSLNDSTGRELSQAQQEYFENSEVVDRQWRLKPVFHATDADFNVFKREHLGERSDGYGSSEYMEATAHIGFWFHEKNLSSRMRTDSSKTKEVYLNIENPYRTSLLYLAEDMRTEYADADMTSAEMGEAYRDELIRQGYDGIIATDEEFGGTSYVIFDSNQAKNVDNLTPTTNPDIRLSLNDSFRTDQAIRKVLGKAVEGETGVGRVWGRRFALPRERLRLSPPPQAHFVFDLFRFYFLYSSAPCRWGMKWSCS